MTWKNGLTIASCVIALFFLVGIAIYSWIKWRKRQIKKMRQTDQQVRVRKITLPGEEEQPELPSYSSAVRNAVEPTIVVENDVTPKVQRSYQNQALEVRSVNNLSEKARNEQKMVRPRAATEPVKSMKRKVENSSEKTWL